MFLCHVVSIPDGSAIATFAGMRTLLPLTAAAIAVLIGCGAPAPEQTPSTAPTSDTTAARPDEGHAAQPAFPAKYRSAWHLPVIDQWDAYWQEQYKADSTGDLRQRTADLDGDGGIDHALFLARTDTTRRDSSYALVVTFSNGRDTLLASYPWAESEGGIGMGLALEPPGELGHLGGEEGEPAIASPVRLEHPAITVIFFEKASITWFWEKGSFHQVWTGD